MSLDELLAAWLPAQRWFAGKGQPIESLTVVADRSLLDGDPALRHLIVAVTTGKTRALYQIPVGVRRDLPARLEHVAIGTLDDGLAVYDALHDPDLAAHLPAWMAESAHRDGIEFHAEIAQDIALDEPSLVLGAEQSNTSVVYGEEHIVKVFRILAVGANPDLEITRALTEAGSPHVAAIRGWADADVEGTRTTLAMLQQYLKQGTEGWALALTSVRDLFAEGDLHADEVGGDFAAEAARLGTATAHVHATLADVLTTDVADRSRISAIVISMHDRLRAACDAVPALRPHADTIRATYDALAAVTSLPLQRVHGDYHLGQVMRTETGWVILDFEGEPGAPIAQRAALSSPLRDVAGMLRSFDYASRYLLADHPQQPAQLEYRAAEWAERNRDAFCDGYGAASGGDPRDHDVVLRAFELDKAVYEVMYEAHHRPGWLPIPLSAIERLTA